MPITAANVIEQRLGESLLLEPILRDASFGILDIALTYCTPTDNAALRIDLNGPLAMGRFTWWSDGSAYLEALRILDGTALLSEQKTLSSSEEAVVALKSLSSVIMEDRRVARD